MRDYCLERPNLVWLGDVIWGLAFTGTRISELVALRWTDVDFEKGMITLSDESAYAGKVPGRTARTLKSGRRRTFPIHAELRPILHALPRHPHGYVFHDAKQRQLTDWLVRATLKQEVVLPLAEQFAADEGERGFADGTPHSFRHFFCSLCSNRRVPEQLLMRWLGHKSSAMVRHYYHANDEEARRQMSQVTLSLSRSA